MDVGDVLRDRMIEPQGLQRMATLSLLAHAGLIAVLLVAPTRFLTRPAETPKNVMTISLGGTPGPRTSGMTSIGARPVQEQTPPDAVKKPEPVRPPAARRPEMTIPTEKPLKAPPKPRQAPEEARGRTPTRGAETSPGTAVAETRARGQGFGLTTGGGGSTGGVQLDVSNFCCPDYIVQMTDRIRANWNQNQGMVGTVIIRFTIQRNGTLTDIEVKKPTGYPALDLSAQRAVYVTRQLAPLPAQFSNPTLTVNLSFEYTR